jgi:DNA-binding CsgD family transcriptional regulator
MVLLLTSSVAMVTVLLLCFLRISSFGDKPSFFDQAGFASTLAAALIGLFIAGILLVASGLNRNLHYPVNRALLVTGLIAAALGLLPAVLSTVLSLPAALFWLGGLLFGLGVCPQLLTWGASVRGLQFWQVLAGCSLVSLLSALCSIAVSFAPMFWQGVLLIALLVCSNIWPFHSICGGQKGDSNAYSSQGAEAEIADKDMNDVEGSLQLGIESPAVLVRFAYTLRDLASVLALPLSGLMLFIVIGNCVYLPLMVGSPPLSLIAVAIVSPLLVVAAWCGRNRPIIPVAYWVVLPMIATALLILDSFPPGTPIFEIGAIGVYFFISTIGVFAIAFLLMVVRRSEPLSLVGLGTVICMVVLAKAASLLLLASIPDMQVRGQMMMIPSTCFFVFMLASTAIQLWRSRRTESIGDAQAPRAAARDGNTVGTQEEREPQGKQKPQDTESALDELAAQYGLSAREREVLGYASKGYSSSYIAGVLFISDNTVRTHLKKIYHKMGVSSRMEIIRIIDVR